MPAHSDSSRALIRYALVGVAVTIAIMWSLYLVRGALLLMYMSVLVGIGLAPLAGAIERYRLPGSRRLPRWTAILIIYLCFLGVLVGEGTAALGLFLMGVPYFYVLALIAGIGEMIPIVGPVMAAIPAIAVAFTVSPGLALGVAVFFFIQQQFENHVLVPKVMERQVGVSAAAVIVALLVGGTLLGVVGAILAVPTVAVAQVIFEELTPEAASD